MTGKIRAMATSNDKTQDVNQTSQSSKTQKNKEEKIVVFEFSSLPQRLQTPKMKRKLDTDNSGFLESKNSKGENEMYGLENFLSYFFEKSNIIKVERKKDDDKEVFIGYDENNNIIQQNTNFSNGETSITRDGKVKTYNCKGELIEIQQGKYVVKYENGKKVNSYRKSYDMFHTYIVDTTFNDKQQVSEITRIQATMASKGPVAIVHREKYEYDTDNIVNVFRSDTVGRSGSGTYRFDRKEQKITDDITKIIKNDSVYYRKNGEHIDEKQVKEELQQIEQEQHANSGQPWYKRLINLIKQYMTSL